MLDVVRLTLAARHHVPFLLVLVALPALADTRFQIRRMMREDVPPGKGQCDIRLQVDGEAEVSIRGDQAIIRTISGRDARDDGSECNALLPNREATGFHFQVIESRNEIRLTAEPSRRNQFAAIVHIRDTSGGEGRYHFRLSWALSSGGSGKDRPSSDRPFGGAGFSWNNTLSFKGKGHGAVSTNDSGETRLGQVNIEIDRGGKLMAWFRTEGRGPALSFTGQVMTNEGGRWKADVMSEDHRLRGPMWITVDERSQVTTVTLEATDGRDRLRLVWDRQ
jgi:hypothetical protein